MEAEVEMETGTEAPSKRDHQSEDAVKRRKTEPDAEDPESDAEDPEYRAQWDDSWWPYVESEGDEKELTTDYYAYQARKLPDVWNTQYLGAFGSFEDETKVPSGLFTDRDDGEWQTSLQIFGVKVIRIRGGLQWPLSVYGRVAVRDSLDHNRNTIFNRSRDNCQILTKEDQSLVLTGPVRAVLMCDPVIFEAELKVKGITESEDKVLSFLAAQYMSPTEETCLIKRCYISKLSELEFTLGHFECSVEATISLRVTNGSWKDDYHGKFAASTSSIKQEQVLLLDCGDKKVPLRGNDILLSRSVVSVDTMGELIVSVEAWQDDKLKVDLRKDEKIFTAFDLGRSSGELDVGFCTMAVTVAWSLFRQDKIS